MEETISDEILMGKLARGDSLALESIYKRHGHLLYSHALRIIGEPEGAEEVLQDTFFQLWRMSSKFDPARGSLIGWLLTITRYRAISHIRQQRGRFHQEALSDDEMALPQNVGPTFLEQHIARELISIAMAGLPEAQVKAITLAYFDGWTCEEIATGTRTPLGTIKARLRSALKTMKKVVSNPALPVSHRRAQRPATLASILITEQLLSRVCRQRSSQEEANSLHALAEAATASAEQLVDSFLKMPIDLCRAGTAGLSLLETNSNGEQVFRWTNLAGKLAKHVGGTTPRKFSPCGVTLDCDSPQLFAYPGRYFSYFDAVDVPIVEGLVIPFHVGGKTEGTVWIVSHEEGSGFDSEDVRIMTSLTEFAGCSLHLMRTLQARDREGDACAP